jgi:5-bromo-4-chloroindolyl phosphate hydrolysis protein
VRYKPVLIQVDPDDWEIFREIAGNYKVSRRVRELVRQDIDKFTREECKAQSFAGLTEA